MNKVDFNYKEFYTVTASTKKHENSFIKQMEHDILNRKKVYDLKYFEVLIDWQIERQSDDTDFEGYLECEHLIKKLKWLKEKNIKLQYDLEQEVLCEKLKAVIPEENLKDLNELIDSFWKMVVALYH